MAICGVGKGGRKQLGCGREIIWMELVVEGDNTGRFLPVDPGLVEPDGETYMMFTDGTTGFVHKTDRSMRGFILHRDTCSQRIGKKTKGTKNGKGHSKNRRRLQPFG